MDDAALRVGHQLSQSGFGDVAGHALHRHVRALGLVFVLVLTVACVLVSFQNDTVGAVLVLLWLLQMLQHVLGAAVLAAARTGHYQTVASRFTRSSVNVYELGITVHSQWGEQGLSCRFLGLFRHRTRSGLDKSGHGFGREHGRRQATVDTGQRCRVAIDDGLAIYCGGCSGFCRACCAADLATLSKHATLELRHPLTVVGVLDEEVGHQLLVLLLLAVLRCQFLHHGQKLLLLHQLSDAYRQNALHGIMTTTLLVQVVHRQPYLLETLFDDEPHALCHLHRHSGCRRLCCVVGRCSSRCAWFRLRLSKRTTIHIQAAHQESLATLLNLLCRQRGEPSGRAVHLVARHQYKTLWGEALRVGLHLQVVVAVVVQIGTELSLRLLDGLAFGHQNPDVALWLARTIFYVEHRAVPL